MGLPTGLARGPRTRLTATSTRPRQWEEIGTWQSTKSKNGRCKGGPRGNAEMMKYSNSNESSEAGPWLGGPVTKRFRFNSQSGHTPRLRVLPRSGMQEATDRRSSLAPLPSLSRKAIKSKTHSKVRAKHSESPQRMGSGRTRTGSGGEDRRDRRGPKGERPTGGKGGTWACDTPRKLPRLATPRVRARGRLGNHDWEFPKDKPAGSRRRGDLQDKPGKPRHTRHHQHGEESVLPNPATEPALARLSAGFLRTRASWL